MSKVDIEKQDNMWVVRINAPERRNALGRAVVQGLQDAADAVAVVTTARCFFHFSCGVHRYVLGLILIGAIITVVETIPGIHRK